MQTWISLLTRMGLLQARQSRRWGMGMGWGTVASPLRLVAIAAPQVMQWPGLDEPSRPEPNTEP